MQNKQAPKQSVSEMLADIKRKDELKRVNAKFGSGKTFEEDQPQTPSKDADPFLDNTTNLMDEAERQILQGDVPPNRESNLLNSLQLLKEGSSPGPLKGVSSPGQRDLDSDEMNEELMDEHAEDHGGMVQPGWKISDEPSQDNSAASTEGQSSAAQ